MSNEATRALRGDQAREAVPTRVLGAAAMYPAGLRVSRSKAPTSIPATLPPLLLLVIVPPFQMPRETPARASRVALSTARSYVPSTQTVRDDAHRMPIAHRHRAPRTSTD